MKILALHLPAFHVIPENNKWWGNGFTEWDNVKKGEPLFRGHIQPLHPYNDNYYNLLDEATLNNQFSIASKYGIDGFIFYHYWFSGHLLFEKPLENLLRDKKTPGNYCLCWANETWSKTWEGKNNEILIEQKYGGEKDWLEHINYLLNFFKDSRYIKVNNCPVLFIYSASQIPNYKEMIDFWNKKLSENNLGKVYIIEFLRAKNAKPHKEISNGLIEFEPMYTIRYDINFLKKAKRYICKKMKFIDFQDYDYIRQKILSRNITYDLPCYKSCFVAWDNSPRKGKSNSIIVKNATPEKFRDYFYKLLNQNRRGSSNDFVVINAWNEWGEGAILEPSKENGYQYLEALKSALLKYENNK